MKRFLLSLLILAGLSVMGGCWYAGGYGYGYHRGYHDRGYAHRDAFRVGARHDGGFGYHEHHGGGPSHSGGHGGGHGGGRY